MALLRAIAQGEPGTGKTGSVAALLDAGYRVILADFDHNPEPLQVFAKDAGDRLQIVTFADELSSGGMDTKGDIKQVGAVSAIRRFTKFLTVGNPALGAPKTWGADTVFVLDSLSSLADSAMRLALKLNGGVTREGSHIGILAGEVEDAMQMFMAPSMQCHRILVAHLKLISPKPDSTYNDQTDLQKQVLRERAALEETAYFPNLPGVQVARTIARMFSTALLYALTDKGQLVIHTKPIKGYTIKVPCAVGDQLPIESGLLTIMKALGNEVPA